MLWVRQADGNIMIKLCLNAAHILCVLVNVMVIDFYSSSTLNGLESGGHRIGV